MAKRVTEIFRNDSYIIDSFLNIRPGDKVRLTDYNDNDQLIRTTEGTADSIPHRDKDLGYEWAVRMTVDRMVTETEAPLTPPPPRIQTPSFPETSKFLLSWTYASLVTLLIGVIAIVTIALTN